MNFLVLDPDFSISDSLLLEDSDLKIRKNIVYSVG